MSFISTRVANGVGEIILDRPKALNALDQSMITEMSAALRAWGDDDAVETVLVTSASERAFCAGGDIRAVREAAVAGDTDTVTEYFTTEYRLNQMIAEYPKPYVSVIDGPAMGGGLGISVHGEVRIVTEKALIAMPETAIGFFPDVGATYFLPRLPDGVGMWLGITGSRVSGADAVSVGLATHFVPSEKISEVVEQIRSGAPLADALRGRHEPVTECSVPLRRIADYFSGDDVRAIVGGLAGGDEWAQQAAAALSSASPTSVMVTGALIAKGATSTLDECLDRELHAAERITATNDFAEGVRAVLVDKDRNPHFDPPSLDAVDPAVVAAIVGP